MHKICNFSRSCRSVFIRGSALKQSRVKPVLRALPEIQQRRGLGESSRVNDSHRHRIASACGREAMLQRLRFHRADDVQAHGGGEQAAQMMEEKQAQPRVSRGNAELAHHRAKDGSEMAAAAAGQRSLDCTGKDSLRRREQCCP